MIDSITSYVRFHSLAGVPTMALPVGLANDGCPLAFRSFGPHLNDARVLAVWLALEQEIGSYRHPP